jgi:peptidoglycan/LPS O-acetylase OafA/YrhL
VSELKHRPEIDGLRALAVVPVVMFHLGLGFPGGFVGVDVFFVISGFLITGIIRHGLENETFSLAEFWERRIRRIFPALFVVVAATLAVGYWLLLPNELEELGKSSVAQALLLANVYFWQDTGYFAGPAEFKPLLHTWSLAVEEQFYLFFPLVLRFLRRLSRKKLFALLTAVALISFAGSVYGAFFHTGATFFLLPTRAWELLIGCMLAVFPWQCKSAPRRDSVIATLGVVAIVLPVFLYDSKTPFPGLAAAPPVLGTAAIIFATACTPSIWLCKALSLRPFVFVGLTSYSLYLWHWPVIVYTRMYFDHFDWKQIIFASVVSLSLAILSWRFVEIPFRRTTFLRQRQRLFASAFALSGAAIAVSVLFIGSNGCTWRFPNGISFLEEDIEWEGREYERQSSRAGRISLTDLPTLGKQSDKEQKIDFVVLGDSHGMAMSKTIHAIADELQLVGKSAVASDTTVFTNASHHKDFGNELTIKREVFQLIDEMRPKNLVLIAFWGNLHNLTLRSPTSSADTSTIVEEGLEDWVHFCSKRGIKLWVVKQVPMTKEPAAARSILRYSIGRTKTLSNQRGTLADHQEYQMRIEEVFQSLPTDEIQFVDPVPLLFDSDQLVINYRDGRALYRDHHHLSVWGAEQIRPALEEMFREMLAQKSTEPE